MEAPIPIFSARNLKRILRRLRMFSVHFVYGKAENLVGLTDSSAVRVQAHEFVTPVQ